MAERDEFDRIVEHLELDLTDLDFPQEATDQPEAERTLQHPADRAWSRSPDAESDEGDDAFYRHPVPPEPRPWSRNVILAWLAVVGGPVGLAICTVIGFFVPRPLLVGIALTFVAGSVYLISQLPDRRPGDDPDDGAVL